MWKRTKRLINSYLDNLIEKASSPDKEARQITRGEVARLNELEVQALAEVKMMEKEHAEVELKLIGVSERERLALERGDAAGAASARAELVALSNHRDMLKQQIGEATASAARARALREERRRVGQDLANDTYLTSMRENLAGIQQPFDASDPSATIEEMRSRLGRAAMPESDSALAEAERQLEAERARSRVDEMLAQYKQVANAGAPQAPEQTEQARPSSATPTSPASSSPAKKEEEPEQQKTLGGTEGPVRPID
jgi:hypothetical protein